MTELYRLSLCHNSKGPTQITRVGPSLPFEPAGIYRMSVNFLRIFLLSASMRYR